MHTNTERLEWNSWNGHLVHGEAGDYLLHVPTTAVFGVDAMALEVIDLCRTRGGRSVDDLVGALASRFEPSRVRAFAAELRNLEMLQPSGGLRPINPAGVKVASYPLSTLVLNVNTGCNLSCTYCYKEDLAKPVDGRKMDFVTAARSVDLLLKTGASRDRLNVVFFGGEPLTNVPLIRQVTAYAQAEASRAGKQVDFSLTTNATLLTPALIDFFDAHRFGISVSMDGPKALHDRHRKSVGGRGTYDAVARKVRMLLDRYRSRPVGARVTLGAGNTAVEAIHAHLRGELGFHEGRLRAGHVRRRGRPCAVGRRIGRGASCVRAVGRGLSARGAARREQRLLQHAPIDDGFTRGAAQVAALRRRCRASRGGRRGRSESLPSVHGSDMPRFGSVTAGIDGERLGAFIEKALDREGTHCETCRIRNLCAGGCYHESYARFGDAHHRTYHYCDLLRSWVDFGVRVYADIQKRNPSFFTRHLEPRSVPA